MVPRAKGNTCILEGLEGQRRAQQPDLLGGPTTSMLLAANFLLLFGLGAAGRWARAAASTVRGLRVTPGSPREVAEAVEGVWLPCPGFIAMPSSSFCEARELFEVLRELAVLPATRLCDRVRFKSASVPEFCELFS